MAKNYMPEIVKMLGAEIGEEVDLIDSDGEKTGVGPHRFTEKGFFNREGVESVYNFYKLLTGECTIQKRPWKPKDREGCWRIFVGNIIDHTIFEKDNIYDLAMVAIGNCFPTKEAAEAGKAETMKKFEEIQKEVR